MSPVNPLSIVGLMLTLASLLGSFFYIHLSQWLRDILGLEQKRELNRFGGDLEKKKALVECRIEYVRLQNKPNLVVNVAVICFVIFVLVLGLLMIRGASSDPIYGYVLAGLVVFLVLFVVLSIGLLADGLRRLRRLGVELEGADQ